MISLDIDTPIGAEVARLEKVAYREHTTEPESEDERGIHTDESAQRLGFEGALVPGMTLLAYMTEMLTGIFGETWLEKGRVKARFRQPIYYQEPVVAKAILKEKLHTDEGEVLVLDLSLESARDQRIAVSGEATCPLVLDCGKPRHNDCPALGTHS